jgi:hypothetical protein
MSVLLENLQTPGHEAAVAAGQMLVERIINVESARLLTSAYNIELPAGYEDYTATRKLMWLKGFSNTYLDTRKGKLRSEVKAVELTEEQEAAIMAFTDELNMQGETNASQRRYGFIEVLGGAKQSNRLRVEHARKQMEADVHAPFLLLLGSERRLKDAEIKDTANYAPGAQTEYDLLAGALETEFGVTDFEEVAFGPDGQPIDPASPDAGKVRFYELPNGTRALLVSAPCVEGKGQANTTDTHNFIGAVLGEERYREAGSILLVTTDVYVPFQHADAMRLLGLRRGLTVESIGYGGIDRPAQAYANEINAAINKAYALNEEIQKLEDYKRILKNPDMQEATKNVRTIPERTVMVGRFVLYVAHEAMKRQAELDSVLADFRAKRWGLTSPEIDDWIYWEVQSDLEHGEAVVGAPEHFSPYAFAAVRGLDVKEPITQSEAAKREIAKIRQRLDLPATPES